MIALEVTVNGKLVTRAGIAGDGVVSLTLSRVTQDGDGELVLEVSGIAGDEHVAWFRSDLGVGETLSVSVVETDEADPPATRYAADSDVVESAEREYYEQLKAKYESK